MDSNRFDRLTTALAAGPSRRGILRLISGGGLLAVLGRAGSDEAAARKKGKKKKKKCKGTTKTCGKRCIPKSNCCTSRQCPQGEVCRNGRCSNCLISEDCTPPSVCRQAACEDGRCVFAPIPGGGQTLECGVGACRQTVQQCVDGEEQQCVPGQPSAEICNGMDDDCDGVIDNGFNLNSDPSHCGECNHACQTETPASCGENGVCAGGNCQKYGSATVCQPASCVGTTLQPAARCDGNGDCVAPPPQNCDPFKCHSNGTTCIGSCGGDEDCVPPNFCDSGTCKPKRVDGQGCQLHSQCASNFCENGTCTAKRPNGEQCSSPFQCASDICVANVCCATFCAGQSCVGGTCQT
jgi:hypothetical protein